MTNNKTRGASFDKKREIGTWDDENREEFMEKNGNLCIKIIF